MVRTRGGCSYGPGGRFCGRGTAGSWGRLVRRGGHWFAPGAGAPTVTGGVRFFGGALPGRGAAWCEGVGIDSHPGRVLLRSGGEFGFLVGAGVRVCL